MIVLEGVAALRPEHGPVFVVIGVFDGLHRGHLYLLEELREAARVRSATPTVVTFDHHPDEVLTGGAPPLLADPAERLERLAAEGVGLTIVQHFDEATRRTPYDAFVHAIADRTALAGFLMTPESAFGFERGGTPDAVAALGLELGYEVVVVPPVLVGGRRVSSAEIREAIAAGNLLEAERLLGRPYAIVGAARVGLDGAALRLEPPMPVALPPAGEYPALVSEAGGDGGRGTEVLGSLVVAEDGTLSVLGRAPAAGRLRVSFR